jgi:hypothetical protein
MTRGAFADGKAALGGLVFQSAAIAASLCAVCSGSMVGHRRTYCVPAGTSGTIIRVLPNGP